jgi:hypothetical protein
MRDPSEGVDRDGYIVTGVRRDRVAGVFVPVIDAAMAAVGTHGGRAVSLYVYGSVATGMARHPTSDVDLLIFGMDAEPADEIARGLTGDFADRCRSVELAVAQRADLDGDSDEAYGNRVFLRHYCAHLCGPPVHAGLPEFRADRRAARGFNGDLADHARRWRSAFEAGADPSELARRVARKSLLAVAGLVSVHDGTWTTDRRTAARRWSAVEPQWATPLATLEAWCESTTGADVDQVSHALDGVVEHLVETFATTIGLWDRR